jgi:hypothetical protein
LIKFFIHQSFVRQEKYRPAAVAGIAAKQIHDSRRAAATFNDLSKQIDWKIVSLAYSLGADSVQLDIGTIQFMHRGYSIQLDSVRYDANGLYLKGFIGNPTNLWISNLTLNFKAGKLNPAGEWKAGDVSSEATIVGAGQTSSIASLSSGSRAPFEVTIPNVRQVPSPADQPTIYMWFSGERYSYGP